MCAHAFELHETAEALETIGVFGAVARVEHADEVDSRCDLRSQPSAEVLAVPSNAESS